MKLDTKEFEAKMSKSVAAYKENLSTIRAGRANPDVLKKIEVDYYGSPTAISSIAEIKVTDARTIVITAWDKSAMKGIEKAILTSDLGIHPQNDGSAIRLNFPPMTEERRKELSKQVARMGEDAKVAIRNIRRDANDKTKAMKKNSEIGGENSLLYALDGRLIPSGDDDGARIGNLYFCYCGDCGGRAVIVYGNLLKHVGVCSACSDGGKIILVSGNRLLHFYFVFLGIKLHIYSPLFFINYSAVMRVPTFSPLTALTISSGSNRPNT